ncbi:hypothetical protein HDU76_001117, partial [Blyttiomyces sp. JEL0837]
LQLIQDPYVMTASYRIVVQHVVSNLYSRLTNHVKTLNALRFRILDSTPGLVNSTIHYSNASTSHGSQPTTLFSSSVISPESSSSSSPSASYNQTPETPSTYDRNRPQTQGQDSDNNRLDHSYQPEHIDLCFPMNCDKIRELFAKSQVASVEEISNLYGVVSDNVEATNVMWLFNSTLANSSFGMHSDESNNDVNANGDYLYGADGAPPAYEM